MPNTWHSLLPTLSCLCSSGTMADCTDSINTVSVCRVTLSEGLHDYLCKGLCSLAALTGSFLCTLSRFVGVRIIYYM